MENGNLEMDKKSYINYILKVTDIKANIINEDHPKVTKTFPIFDKDKKGYLIKEDIIKFYYNSIKAKKIDTVWNNIDKLGYDKNFNEKIISMEENTIINKNCLFRY